MTEIKFRAWDKISKYLFEVSSIDFENGLVYECRNHFDGIYRKHNLKDIILMLSSGLIDENGVEIYDGDIICPKLEKQASNGGWICGSFGYHLENYKVVSLDCDMWVVNKTERLSDWIRWKNNYHTDFKVIGNIYENPELIKETT